MSSRCCSFRSITLISAVFDLAVVSAVSDYVPTFLQSLDADVSSISAASKMIFPVTPVSAISVVMEQFSSSPHSWHNSFYLGAHTHEQEVKIWRKIDHQIFQTLVYRSDVYFKRVICLPLHFFRHLPTHKIKELSTVRDNLTFIFFQTLSKRSDNAIHKVKMYHAHLFKHVDTSYRSDTGLQTLNRPQELRRMGAGVVSPAQENVLPAVVRRHLRVVRRHLDLDLAIFVGRRGCRECAVFAGNASLSLPWWSRPLVVSIACWGLLNGIRNVFFHRRAEPKNEIPEEEDARRCFEGFRSRKKTLPVIVCNQYCERC